MIISRAEFVRAMGKDPCFNGLQARNVNSSDTYIHTYINTILYYTYIHTYINTILYYTYIHKYYTIHTYIHTYMYP